MMLLMIISARSLGILSADVRCLITTDTRKHTFTDEGIHYKGEDDDDNADTEPADGEYWVRMVVTVSGDSDNNVPEFFAKQIVVQPDYVLSVNPGSVREDADATIVTVRASKLAMVSRWTG